MYRLLENHGKTVVIFLGVFLMIAFLLPAGWDRFVGGPGGGAVGTFADGSELSQLEVQQAGNRVENMRRLIDETPRGDMFTLGAYLPPELVEGFADEPALLPILLREADRRGVTVSEDDVLAELRAPGRRFRGDGEAKAYADITSVREAEAARLAMRDLLLLREIGDRALSFVKVSTPAVDRALAIGGQESRLRYTLVDAEPLLAEIESPGDDEARARFDALAAVAPGRYGDDNPLGLGYRLPDGVKLHVVEIDVEAIERQVVESRTEADWELAARKLYLQNKDRFARPPEPTTQPTGETAPAEPVVPEFEEVRDEAIAAVQAPEVQRQVQKVVERIGGKATQDMQRVVAADATGGEVDTTQTLGENPRSFEYLVKLADDVEQRLGVRPRVVDLTDRFRGREQLLELEGIGGAFLVDRRLAQGGAMFADLALRAEPLVSDDGLTVPLGQLSQPLIGAGGKRLLFRLTDARPSMPATDFEAVREQVVEDLRRERAVLMAAERAAALAAGGFDGLPEGEVFESGYLRGGTANGETPELIGLDAQRLAQGSLALLGDGPDAVGGVGVPLPERFAAAGVTLIDSRPVYADEQQQTFTRAVLRQQLAQALVAGIDPFTGRPADEAGNVAAEVFTPEAIRRRAGFEYAENFGPRSDEDEEEPESPEA